MNREQFINTMASARLYDLTQDCSIFTPPWPGEKALEVHFFKRVTGAYGGGQGANGMILNWSNTVGTHLYRIKQKLGIQNMAELAMAAVRAGLIEV